MNGDGTATQSAVPQITPDPDLDPRSQYMQSLNQGGVAVVSDDGDPGFVHHNGLDDFLQKNPKWHSATVLSGPDGEPRMVKSTDVGNFISKNPDYRPGIDQRPPETPTVPVVDQNGQSHWMHHAVVDDYLQRNPGAERAMVITGPKGEQGMVAQSKAQDVLKNNAGWKPGQQLPSESTAAQAGQFLQSGSVPIPGMGTALPLNPLGNAPDSALRAGEWIANYGGVPAWLKSQFGEGARVASGIAYDVAHPPFGIQQGPGGMQLTPTRGSEGPQGSIARAESEYPVSTAVAQGLTESAGGLATDPNFWILGPGASTLPATAKAAPILAKMAGYGFDAQMLQGAYQSNKAMREAADRGDVHETARLMTDYMVNAGFLAHSGVSGAANLYRTGPPIAEDFLRRSAEQQEQRVLLQGGGTKKEKATAAKVAPQMAERGVRAWTRGGLQEKAEAQAEIAGRAVDNFYQSLPPGAGIPTQPLLDYFDQAKNQFIAPDSGVVLDQKAIDKVDALKQIVQKFGPDVTLNDIVSLRRIWDKQVAASRQGHVLQPADDTTAMAIQSEAADAIRGELAQRYPNIDKINKEFSFWKNVATVMSATNLRKGGHGWLSLQDLFAGSTGAGLFGHGMVPGFEGIGAGVLLSKAMKSTGWETTSAKLKYDLANLLARGKTKQAAQLFQSQGQQPPPAGGAAGAPPAGGGPPPPAAGGPQQQPLPFGPQPLWGIHQTPGTPPAAPAAPTPPLTGQQTGLPFGQGPLWQMQQTPTSVPPETTVTSPSRMLGPARLPASIRNPSPNLEAPMAPSPSAEASAVQQAAEKGRGRGPVGTLRQLGMVPGPSGFPEAKVTQTATPAGEVSPEGTPAPAGGTPVKKPLFSRSLEPQRAGSAESTRRDNEFLQQAKAEKPDGSVREWLQRAQELKQQAQQPAPSPLGGVPLFSRPLTAPSEPTSQLDLGLGLPRRAEPFYSKAEQVADAKLPKSGSGDSFLATLRNSGVKAEELSDLKLDDFAGKPKVTKEEFLDAIRSRRPELSQTQLHGDDETSSYEKYTTPGGQNYRETLTQYPQSQAGANAESFRAEADARQRQLDEDIDQHNAAKNPEDLGFPDDYFDKERAAIRNLREQQHYHEGIARTTDYQSGHWPDQPNVLVHDRESDFTTTDGMPVRHVHEIQSDLHQLGRESGYRTPPIRTLPEGFHTERTPQGYYRIVDREGNALSTRAALPTREDAIDDFISRYNSMTANTSGAPNAPFKKSWHELAVKDSIRRAIEDGKQGMTWDTGATQADRYDLAKEIERIEYDPDTQTLDAYDHGGKRVVNESAAPEELHKYIGEQAAAKLQDKIDNYYPPSRESDYSIEHDPESETYHILDQDGERIGEEETHRDAERTIERYVQDERDNQELPTLRGLDLKVGGEGMKGFYDKMIPDFVRKYTKKWGAKVDTAEIPTGEGVPGDLAHYVIDPNGETHDAFPTRELAHAAARDAGPGYSVHSPETTTVHRLTFTPEMINAIKSEGQPLYARNLRPGEDEMEAARRGAGGEAPPPSRMQQAQINVDSLRTRLEQQRAAGDSAQYNTVSQLRNAEDELASAHSQGQPLFAKGKGVSSAQALETLKAAREMQPRLDEGGPDRAARLHIDDATYKLLNNLVPGSGDWSGINFHEHDARNIAKMLRGNADQLEPTGQSTAVANMRMLADQIDRAHMLNSDPNAPGHGGVPIVKHLSSEAHEAETHVGQRTLSPTGDVIDYTNAAKAADHPAVRKAWPALEKIGATDHPGLAVAELEAHILDGNHEFFGLSREEALDFMEHTANVLAEHHGERIADPPRLAQRYIQSLRSYVEGGRGGGQQAAAPETQLGRTAEVQAEGGRGGQPAQGPAPPGAGETNPQEVTPQRTPLQSSVKLMRKPLPVTATGPAGRLKVGDVGKALQKYSRVEEGPPIRASEATRDEMIKRYAKAAVPEVKYQLAQDKSGLNWYKDDITNTQRTFAQNGYPELDPDKGDPVKQTMFRALMAGASLGNREIPTIRNAEKMWNEYKRTGKAPLSNPETGLGYQNGQFNAYQWGFKALNQLLEEKGEKGAAQWLMTQHPVSELKQYRNYVPGKAADMKYGAHIFGDKMGPFFLNMSGIHDELTADLWHSRRFNRIMGTLEDPSTETGLADAPRNSGERSIMKQAEQYVARKLGLDTSASQSVGWNYEQSLYNVHGIERELASYADAARQHFAGRATPAQGANAPASGGPAAAGKAPVSRGLPQGVGRGQPNLPPKNPSPAPIPPQLKRVMKR